MPFETSQGRLDQLPFRLLEIDLAVTARDFRFRETASGTRADPLELAGGWGVPTSRGEGDHRGGATRSELGFIDVGGSEAIALGEHGHASHEVFELAHVSGPVIALQSLDEAAFHFKWSSTASSGRLSQQMARESRNVFQPISQRRHFDWNDGETKIEILAKTALGDFASDIARATRDILPRLERLHAPR